MQRQLRYFSGEVEAVADDELVGDVEADVAQVELHLLEPSLRRSARDLERRGLAPGEVLQQVLRA